MKKIIAALLISCATALYASIPANPTTTNSPNTNPEGIGMYNSFMVLTDQLRGNCNASIKVANSKNHEPQVEIDTDKPATLSIYQGHKVVSTKNLPVGITTLNSADLPVGKITLVIQVSDGKFICVMKHSINTGTSSTKSTQTKS